MRNPTRFKLGRAFGTRSAGLPRMGAFLNSVSLPPLPDRVDWYSSVASFAMLMNDVEGDCTIACVGHMTQQESIYAGVPAVGMTDEEADSQYRALSGYDPSKPETDTGLYEGDVGKHWVSNGFMVGGKLDKIIGFADCDIRDLNETKYAILLTGNAMLGIMLPSICEERLDLWDVPTNPDDAQLIGAHCIPVMGWDADHWLAVSWGQLVPMTNAFVQKYVLESHVTLSKRWMNAKNLTPSGISWDYLVEASRQFSHAVT